MRKREIVGERKTRRVRDGIGGMTRERFRFRARAPARVCTYTKMLPFVFVAHRVCSRLETPKVK